MCYVEVSMRRSPRNVKIAFSHAGLTHYGGILFFNEFSRMLQLRRFLTRRLRYPRRNHDYAAFPNDPVLSLPDHPGLGSSGDGVALTFEWHLSVFDRSSDLPHSTKLAAIFVASRTRFSGATPPRQ